MGRNYIWYHPSCKSAAVQLAHGLEFDCGKSPPGNFSEVSSIICWGTRPPGDFNFNLLEKIKCLNHPEMIRANTNKLFSLMRFQNAGLSIPRFVLTRDINVSLYTRYLSLPIIGRTRYHQQGNGFFLVLNNNDLERALEGGVAYFQQYVRNKEEYRVHVFAGRIIRVIRKRRRSDSDIQRRWVEKELERQSNLLPVGRTFDEETVRSVLEAVSSRVTLADHQKKNGFAWEHYGVKRYPPEIEIIAFRAIDATGLQFGAVDIILDDLGKSWLLEVNSAPGLDEYDFKAWLEAFERYFGVENRADESDVQT